jgi:hypothetical protein
MEVPMASDVPLQQTLPAPPGVVWARVEFAYGGLTVVPGTTLWHVLEATRLEIWRLIERGLAPHWQVEGVDQHNIGVNYEAVDEEFDWTPSDDTHFAVRVYVAPTARNKRFWLGLENKLRLPIFQALTWPRTRYQLPVIYFGVSVRTDSNLPPVEVDTEYDQRLSNRNGAPS